MNKKLVAMLSALSLCVTVTACSKNEDNTKLQSNTNKTSINIIEVKAGEDKSSPSFKKCINENNELQGIRYSRRNYIKNGKIINIPLYLVNKTIELI